MPELSLTTQTVIRVLYLACVFGTLAISWPNLGKFFFSESRGGYGPPRFSANPIAFALWFLSLLAMALNQYTFLASLVNAGFCYHFFIRQRWSSLLRGMGAPGFMMWWIGVGIATLELSLFFPTLRPLIVLALQLDLAIIMLSAGIYKLSAGYLRNDGMELGLVNPMWGYWWSHYRKLPHGHWVFWILNQLAWFTEIGAAILMLTPIPEARLAGGIFLAMSFGFIAANIRLGFLCEMVIVTCLFFIPAGSMVDKWIAPLGVLVGPAITVDWSAPEILRSTIQFFLYAYIILRPLALLGLYWNFYAGRRFRHRLQIALEAYANLFGIILWRVFTKEVTNFYIEIYRAEANGQKTLLSRYTSLLDRRFNHVGEAITVVTLFTSLKYFSDGGTIFRARLLRYAKTLGLARTEEALFVYVAIEKDLATGRFTESPLLEAVVNPSTETIEVHSLRPGAFAEISPGTYAAQACRYPGSYVTALATKGL